MKNKKHKEWVEHVRGESDIHDIEHPIDGWIEMALYTDERHVKNMLDATRAAIAKMKFELEHVPTRWVHVKERKVSQLSMWVALQDRLCKLWASFDTIPF